LTFFLFIPGLIEQLDNDNHDWRTTTALLDNALIHRSRAAKGQFEALGLPLMYLAPYSFKMAAVEKLFSFVKNRDLSPLVARAYLKNDLDMITCTF
jgi:transposase